MTKKRNRIILFLTFSILFLAIFVEIYPLIQSSRYLNNHSPIAPVFSIRDVGKFHLSANGKRDAFQVTVANRDVDEWPAYDYFSIQIHSAEGKLVAQKDFYSSYGHVEIDLIDLTNDGIEEFVLLRQQGRGPNAWIVRLEILQLCDGKLSTILDTLTSEPFTLSHRWWFKRSFVQIEESQSPGLLLVLDYDSPEIGECWCWWGTQWEDTPSHKIEEYVWDPVQHRIVLNRAIGRPYVPTSVISATRDVINKLFFP